MDRKPTSWAVSDRGFVAPPRREDVKGIVLDGETVLIDSVDGSTHHLNETGGFVWRQCDGKTTTAEIALHLSARFAVEADAARRDVEQMIVMLADLGLLRLSGR